MAACGYLKYEETFLLARGALLAVDLEALQQLSAPLRDRGVAEALAISLAITDAKRGLQKRTKAAVCSALALVCRCDASDPRRDSGELHRSNDSRAPARRSARRIARAFQADLRLRRDLYRVVTLDVAPGGFSALLETVPPVDTDVEFLLRIPRADPVRGIARVVSTGPREANHRVSFRFESVSTPSLKALGALCLAG